MALYFVGSNPPRLLRSKDIMPRIIWRPLCPMALGVKASSAGDLSEIEPIGSLDLPSPMCRYKHRYNRLFIDFQRLDWPVGFGLTLTAVNRWTLPFGTCLAVSDTLCVRKVPRGAFLLSHRGFCPQDSVYACYPEVRSSSY